jgi:hypothetical protein
MAQEYEAVQAATPLLNCINRLARTRMPGGVAGVQSIMTAPYADLRSVGKVALPVGLYTTILSFMA